MIRIALLAALIAAPAWAAGPVDPDWPCIQRRQPQLSIGQVWSGPPPDAAITELARTPAVQEVARIIALRRTGMDQAEAMVGAFAETQDSAALVALFVATFDHVQSQRDRVMSGITRYAHKQEALDRHIKAKRQEFAALSAAEAPDFDAIDKAEEDIDWSTRIFQDRQQSLTYVCEAPVILEQRIFAIGRTIAGHLP
ncbi:MAG: hypothetical protein ACT4OK_16740 [Gemmobacter sp.]